MLVNSFKNTLDNTPHLMTPEAFISACKFFEVEPNAEAIKLASLANSSEEVINYNPDTQLGVIYIEGSLTYRTEWYQRYFGGTSYESIKKQFEDFIDSGAKTILFWQDSGGGSAYNMMETGNYLRKLADDNDVTIFSYSDGVNASASYGLGCIADQVIANPDATVGSVGVVVRLRNTNKALKSAGVEDTFIHYGSQKIPYDKNGEWDKTFTDKIQSSVDSLGEKFTDYVAGHRRQTVEAIKSLEAATFDSEEALSKGLIDHVMTHEEFSTYLADYVQKEKTPKMFNNKLFKLTSEQEKVEMKELDDAKAELSSLQIKLTAELDAKTALESVVTELNTELETIKTKLASFEELSQTLEAEKEALAKAQAEAKTKERKEQLAAVVAEDKVDEIFTALADAPQALFDIAIGGYKAAEEAKQKSAEFNELGGNGEAVDHGTPNPVDSFLEWQKKHYKSK